VPQGSGLSPLLFLAFINDLPPRVKLRTGMFALLNRKFKSKDDAPALQDELYSLQVCVKERQMEFNAAKCEVINHQEEPHHLLISNTPTQPNRPSIFELPSHQTYL
jgi:hypothetical protein